MSVIYAITVVSAGPKPAAIGHTVYGDTYIDSIDWSLSEHHPEMLCSSAGHGAC